MGEKHYDTDWAKSKSRDLCRDFYTDTVLKSRKPGRVQVLCFPGVDGQEILDVYDRLGILRQNIVGVEREAPVAREIRKSFPDITVWEGDLDAMVSDTSKRFRFDIVSTDYIGPISFKQMTTMQKLADRQEADVFAMHVANLVRRDGDSRDLYFTGYSASATDFLFNGEFDFEKGHLGMQIRSIEFSKAFISDPSVDDKTQIKHESYSRLVQLAVAGREFGILDKLLNGIYGRYLPEMLRSVERRVKQDTTIDVRLDDEFPSETQVHQLAGPVVGSLLTQLACFGIRIEIEEHLSPQLQRQAEDVARLLYASYMAGLRTAKRYISQDSKAYSYISESGAPMIGDLHLMLHPRKMVEISQRITRMAGLPKRHIAGQRLRPLAPLLEKVQSQIMRKYTLQSPEREFLGNSSKPVLTRARAIEEFTQGHSTDEVKEKYRGWENKPLAAWKAHVTMGTYAEIPEDNGDIECISKADAIELLSAGIPSQEVLDAYPTSFTIGQLRAFKKHITMGTYEEKAEASS